MGRATATGGGMGVPPRWQDRLTSVGAAWSFIFGLGSDVSRGSFYRAFAAITVVATALRFWNLDAVALWGDESISVVQANLSLQTLLFGNIDFHPPLYELVHKAWASVFPQPALARVPAAVAGALTVPVLMLCVRDLSSGRAALFCGLLLAVSTGHVYFSQEARMYSLIVLGLVLTAWGAGGFAMRGKLSPKVYGALYVVGGVIMIGSHVLGLVFMAILGCVSLFAAWTAPMRKPAFVLVIAANLLVLLLAGPWIWHILMASDDHPGLSQRSVALLVWYISNMAGFPGLGSIAKLLELALFGLAGLSIVIAIQQGQRPLAVLLIGLIIALPIALGLLHLRQPVLADRVVLPVVIGITIGVGVTLAHIRQPLLQWGLLAVLAGASLASTGVEMANRQKWDDYRAAFAFVDRHGLENAAVLTCRQYAGSAILAERPGTQMYYFKPDGVLIQSRPGYWQISAVSVAQLEGLPAHEIDARLGGGYLLEQGLETLVDMHDQIAFMRPYCLRDDTEVIDAAMAAGGFRKVAHAEMTPPEGTAKVFLNPRTLVTLYEKTGSAQ